MNKRTILIIIGVFVATIIFIATYAAAGKKPNLAKSMAIVGLGGVPYSEFYEASNTPSPTETEAIVGLGGVPQSEFQQASELGAQTVGLFEAVSAPELQSALNSAKALDLTLIGRARGRSAFQTDENKLDFDKLREITEELFHGSKIAADPNFSGYYLIDEPCHKDKWNIDLQDLSQAYNTVKSVDSDITVLINFAQMNCLESFVGEASDIKVVDIATFVITPKKIRKDPDYIANSAASASRVKMIDPDLRVVPLLAVYEYPARGEELPTAEWVQETGEEVLRHADFDGIMYFPWSPSSYMGDTIEDIAQVPDYREAFRNIFGAR